MVDISTAEGRELWIIANIQAQHAVIRSLADANDSNPAFIEALKKLHNLRDSKYTYSTMSEDSIEEYNKTIRDLVSPNARSALG